ncbi:MAG TPA: PEP-CTERM sorting domain-containing protein [Rhizomicrobium sp.]|jgi:hypothetical protein|nr:PEP-CTERM sorting domain-containing protein [Rhizomicrobium sp.]
MKKTAYLFGAISVVAALAAAPASAGTINVTPGHMDGWAFSNTDNTGTNASGALVAGPAMPPIGNGSAQLVVGDANSSEILYDLFSPRLSLGSITALSYQTYVATSTPGSGAAPALDFDLYTSTGAYDGRLVFDPGLLPSAVQDGVWQNWSALTSDAWYFTANSLKPDCGIAGNYCTFSEALGFIPGVTAGDVLFKAGSDQASFNGNVDDLVLNGTTYNFDVPEPFTLSLFGAGLAGMGAMRRRRKA